MGGPVVGGLGEGEVVCEAAVAADVVAAGEDLVSLGSVIPGAQPESWRIVGVAAPGEDAVLRRAREGHFALEAVDGNRGRVVGGPGDGQGQQGGEQGGGDEQGGSSHGPSLGSQGSHRTYLTA